MRLLLDTHAFLWWIFDDPRLASSARALISDPATEILFSVVSAWEIAIKARTGRLDLPADVPAFVHDQVRRNRVTVLPVSLRHALHVHALPDHHRDPFDRLLVAQAQVEAVPLLSKDAQLATYDVTLRW
ncbi:MAG: type II toxin-antitoxin system VapC family toxin [Geminicoccaceae bacterium]